VRATRVKFLLILFKHHVYNGFGGHYFNLTCYSFCIIFLFFLSSFRFEKEGSSLSFSMWRIENAPTFCKSAVYTFLEYYGTLQTRMTGLQDSVRYLLRMLRSQMCVTRRTSNNCFLDAHAFCSFYFRGEYNFTYVAENFVISLTACHA
jgi:hypothetical protein